MKLVMCVFAGLTVTVAAQAVTITHGSTSIDMDFVNIEHAGNVAGARGYGTVNYDYLMGKHEVSIRQFNLARAADSRIGDGNEGYWNAGARSVGLDAPASRVSWYEAAQFVNWLTTGDAYTGVYQFDQSGSLVGFDRSFRNSDDKAYVLPTLDEWYKAACFKPDGSGYTSFANGSNSSADLTHGTADGWNYVRNTWALGSPNYVWEVDVGGEEQNGTHNMMGNVSEWNETSVNGILSARQGFHGGNYGHRDYSLKPLATWAGGSATPSESSDAMGFRVAAIPEPASAGLLALVSGGIFFVRRFFVV